METCIIIHWIWLRWLGLDLSNTGITTKSIEALQKALQTNQTLVSIVMKDKDLDGMYND